MAKRLLVGTVLTLIAFIGAMPAVQGDTRTFNDSTTDETSYMGIRWVKVQNGWTADGTWHNNLKIVTRVNDIPHPPDFAGITSFFIDTKPSNAGPEYRLRVIQDVGLYRVNSWNDHGTAVPWGCGAGRYGYDAWYGQAGGDYNRVITTIKRACIGHAGKVRVSVHTTVENRPRQQDWAKARTRFYPWVLR